MTAKYYIYRNLRTKGFSVRHNGKVIDRLHTLSADGVIFKVNELGRQSVIKRRQKNVHAFVVADKYTVKNYPALTPAQVDSLGRVTYNPYLHTQFMCNNRKIDTAKKVMFQNGKCFLVE